MTFHIITIFPQIFDSYFNEGIIRRAWKLKNNIEINIYDLRNYTTDKHKTVDDTPYGGGPGMVLKVEPIYKCLQDVKNKIKAIDPKVKPRAVLFSAKGKKYSQKKAWQYTKAEHLILICGRYEGVDERVAENLVDEEISIGNYVLTGGEIPAMVVVDSVTRLLPGVLGNPESLVCETYNNAQEVDYPVYTKPEEFQGWQVPKVLLEGNHKEIDQWRKNNQKK